MLRRLLLLLLLGLGLGPAGPAHAVEAPRIELTAAPAWKGWSRPGRATEVDVRLSADAATPVLLELTAGRGTMLVALDLQPGRPLRLQVPVAAAEQVRLSAVTPGSAPLQRDVAVAWSESPTLGLALAVAEPVTLKGFHPIALAADDLPRHASAYASVDAMIVDAPTLAALDPRQMAALLAHAAACGRIVLVDVDAGVRRLLGGAGGCGGLALLNAASPAQAGELLAASLNTALPAALSPAGVGELLRPRLAAWNAVAVGLAVYFALALLVLLFVDGWPVLLLTPTLAAAAALGLLHALQPASQLLIWSEADSGAQMARYQGWQRFPGLVRGSARVAIPHQLARAVQPCHAEQALRLEFDAGRGLVTFAEFEARLFQQVLLCYAGSFPVSRTLALGADQGGLREVRNAGTQAWPAGTLLAAGQVHELPALAPGAAVTVDAKAARSGRDAALRTALARTRPDEVAALWALELGGVADLPAASQAWLLVSVPVP